MWPAKRYVALRKESVDRNQLIGAGCAGTQVALRKESVDRNVDCGGNQPHRCDVALRKESVDRNFSRVL